MTMLNCWCILESNIERLCSAGNMIYIQHYNSYVGGITISSDGNALTGLWFDGQKYYAGNIDDEIEEKDLPVFAQARQWLDIYFSRHDPGFTPALTLDSTPFRMAVWRILLTIPFGKTMTYGEIAARIAELKGIRRMSAQAVGSAVGHNPISLIIPCHRVVGADGSMTGYAGGIDRKIKLLEMERSACVWTVPHLFR